MKLGCYSNIVGVFAQIVDTQAISLSYKQLCSHT